MSEILSNPPRVSRVVYELVDLMTSDAVFYIRLAFQRVRRARTAKILRKLSDEHLRDVGIDRSLIQSGPQSKVDARVMTYLMSLR